MVILKEIKLLAIEEQAVHVLILLVMHFNLSAKHIKTSQIIFCYLLLFFQIQII